MNTEETISYSITQEEASKHKLSINDPINHPAHYTNGEIECIDAIKSSMSLDSYEGYLKGNVFKYLWRYRYKNSPVEDLKKAQWYLSRLIDLFT